MTMMRSQFLARSTVAGSALAVGVLRWPACAAQFNYKLASDQAATHPMTIESLAAAKRILDASGGALEIKVFPNSALGGDPEMLAQTRSGAIELLQTGNNILGSVIPASGLLNVPFAFRSANEFGAAANGPLGAYIGAAAEKIGLRKFPQAFYGGSFHIQNSVREINVPGDLKGLKVRVPPGPLDVATFKAFEATPTVISLAEVYTSLMTHVVDGIEVPLPTLQNFKFYEQVKYCALTNHANLAYFLLANNDAWARLPAKFQDLLEREFTAAANTASKAFIAQESSVIATLQGEGMHFTRPSTEPFRAIVRAAGLYATWKAQFDPKGWDVMEKTTGPLGSA